VLYSTTEGEYNCVRLNIVIYMIYCIVIVIRLAHKNGKTTAVPLQAWSGPEGSRKLRFQDYVTI